MKALTHEQIRTVIHHWNWHWMTKEPGYEARARLCDANMAHHLADLLIAEQSIQACEGSPGGNDSTESKGTSPVTSPQAGTSDAIAGEVDSYDRELGERNRRERTQSALEAAKEYVEELDFINDENRRAAGNGFMAGVIWGRSVHTQQVDKKDG